MAGFNISVILSTIRSTINHGLLLLSLAIVGKIVVSAVYNLFFHPLRHFPGPKLAAATPLPFVWRILNGKSPAWTIKLHEKYGVVVRIHPDELSFIGPSTFSDIYLARPQLPKPTFGVLETPNGVPPMTTIPDPERHGKQRKIIGHAFSDRAVKSQEYILQQYTDLLITRLQDQVKNGNELKGINITEWYNYMTFDVVGDLCFGESFHCLEKGDNHPWIAAVFKGVKFAQILTIFFYFPPMYTILKWCIPPPVKEIAMRSHTFTRERIDKRIESKSERPDFMKYILENNYPGGMTRDDIDANVTLLVLAGSETSAQTLTGATYFSLKNLAIMRRLQDEIRSAFSKHSDIDVASVTNLPYLHAVIQETLRRHPTAPIAMPREVDRPGVIVCGHPVPQGYRAGIPQKAAFLSPSNFVEPESFSPERWLEDGDGKFREDKKQVFEPFMVGPRNCIGKTLAWAELKLVLAKMIWNFDMELSEKNVGEWNDQLVYLTNEKTPLYVRIRPRV